MCLVAQGTRAMNKTHGVCIRKEETDIDTFKCNIRSDN